MKIVAVIQARMGSSRLPGKVLMDVVGESMLARVICRTQRTECLDEVIVATTDRPEDNEIIKHCDLLGIRTFRGSEYNVLDRYYKAAQQTDADIIIRITADCPLIDPDVVGTVLHKFLRERPDYASNTRIRTFPRGLDCEVFTAQALERTWQEAKAEYEQEHVTPYIYGHPELFDILSVDSGLESSYGSYRWTVDEADDLKFVRLVYEHFEGSDEFTWRDVVALIEAKPELVKTNEHVRQKPLQTS